MQFQKQKAAIAALLIAVSVLSLQPGITLAAPNSGSTAISMNAFGQAVPIGGGENKGSQTNATLTLLGNCRHVGNQLKFTTISGTLQVGSTSYSLSGGQGESNANGELEIRAKSSRNKGNLELVLHGYLQGNNVTFTQPQSKLASLFFLSLAGQLDDSTDNTNSTTTNMTQNQTTTMTQGNMTMQQQTSTTTWNPTTTQTTTTNYNSTVMTP
jgi:hypothetical protein